MAQNTKAALKILTIPLKSLLFEAATKVFSKLLQKMFTNLWEIWDLMVLNLRGIGYFLVLNLREIGESAVLNLREIGESLLNQWVQYVILVEIPFSMLLSFLFPTNCGV